MSIGRTWLFRHLLVSIALFVIAAPLGDNQHGMGKHSSLAATVGQTIFVTFVISFALLLVAVVVAAVQYATRRRRTGQNVA